MLPSMQFDNTTNSQCPKKSLRFNKPMIKVMIMKIVTRHYSNTLFHWCFQPSFAVAQLLPKMTYRANMSGARTPWKPVS